MMHRLGSCTLWIALPLPRAIAQDVPELRFDGQATASAVRQALTDTTWVNDLAALRAEAQATGKLIYWVQLVGELNQDL